MSGCQNIIDKNYAVKEKDAILPRRWINKTLLAAEAFLILDLMKVAVCNAKI